jgi:hypothetical protein
VRRVIADDGGTRTLADSRPTSRPAAATSAPARAPARLAALQRSAGNRATGRLLRQLGGPHAPNPAQDPRAYKKGAPNAKKCAPPPGCPPGFCDPYESEGYAKAQRARDMPWLMAGIWAAVDSRVVPLWREHLGGGSAPKDLTAEFGKDFASSVTTAATTKFLVDAVAAKLRASPPVIAPLATGVDLPLATLIPAEIAAIDDPDSLHAMDFNIPKEIPGNLAGGIGKDEVDCKSGAKPSPFNDERIAAGTVRVTQIPWGGFLVAPVIDYTVRDTIDLCPGNCGTELEQLATVAISQYEATGISGDVPFTVRFTVTPAPFVL